VIVNTAFCIGVIKVVVATLVVSDKMSEGQTFTQASKSTFDEAVQLYKSAGDKISKEYRKYKK